MKKSINRRNGRRKPTIALVTKALNQAAQDAVEAHRRADQPLAVWQHGQTVLVSPESVEPADQVPKPRRGKST
ncbi:MAG: hypothetical protein WD069_06820 [Planctomycetales bacterium]